MEGESSSDVMLSSLRKFTVRRCLFPRSLVTNFELRTRFSRALLLDHSTLAHNGAAFVIARYNLDPTFQNQNMRP